MKTPTIAILAALLLTSCDETPSGQPTTYQVASPAQAERFTISKVSTFRDTRAYHDYRDVFLIRDVQTGQEFIGISGVGVSQLGSHNAGKHQVSDER